MSQLTATLQIVESAHSRRNGNGVVVLIREVAGILGEFGNESHICELWYTDHANVCQLWVVEDIFESQTADVQMPCNVQKYFNYKLQITYSNCISYTCLNYFGKVAQNTKYT